MPVVPLNAKTLPSFVQGRPSLVYWWAGWCVPCRAAGKHVETLSREYGKTVGFGSVDVDLDGELATRYLVETVPTFIVFRDGVPLTAQNGGTNYYTLKKMLGEASTR